VWMGGAAAAGGNATSWAEANAFYDPEAAHVVLSAGLPITIYTWDVYLKVPKSHD
jgi:pyrimidine-specific ribonucleoside hydrolase